MKIGFGKRVLMFLHWLFSLLICIVLVLAIFFPYILDMVKTPIVNLLGDYKQVGTIAAGAVLGVIYLALCICQASIIFTRRPPRSERGFITVDSSDNSRIRIAISAIEQMVRQSVNSIDGISDMKIAIDSADDAIEIKVNAGILAGRHVPTITMNMQQAIRKFVEMNCGVAVRSVSVNINSVVTSDANGRKKLRGKAAKQEESIIPVVPMAYETTSAPVITETVNEAPAVDDAEVSETACEYDEPKNPQDMPVTEDSEESIVGEENADKQ